MKILKSSLKRYLNGNELTLSDLKIIINRKELFLMEEGSHMFYRFQAINEYYNYDGQINELINKKMKISENVVINWIYLNHEKVEMIYYFDNTKKYHIDMEILKNIKRQSEIVFEGDNFNILQVVIDEAVGDNSYFLVTSTVQKPENLFNDQVFVIFMSKTKDSSSLLEKIKKDASCIITLANNIKQNLTKFERLYNVVDELVKILTEKDRLMPNHMTNVAHYSLQMAIRLGLSQKDANLVYLAGLLHDIGKLYISDAVLNADRKLTFEEYEVAKTHSLRGYSIAKTIFMDVEIFGEVPKISLYHHENFDGTGYPMKLKGEGIPLFARIVRICDSVDAMLSRRQYKNPMGFSEVIMELKKYSGTHYDPDLVLTMISILKESKLSDTSFKDIEGSVMPDISINLQIRNAEESESISYSGNMIVYNNNHIEFISKSSKMISGKNISRIEDCRLFFMITDNCFECGIKLKSISGNKIYLENIRFGMLDDLFSLPWSSEVVLGIKEDLFVKMEMLILGASMSILKLDNNTYSKIHDRIGKEAIIYFNESLDFIQLKESINVIVERIYKMSDGMVFICKYISIAEFQRDKIFKLLFKKQALKNKIINNS